MRGGGNMSEVDPEITALTTLIKILEPLENEQRLRVLNFVFHKLNIRMPEPVGHVQGVGLDSELAAALGTELEEKSHQASSSVAATDIRTLKDAKRPRTASEMTALVAFYLEHVAVGTEKRNFITGEDIKPYFNQAGFPLPTGPTSMTLTNAKNAGYLNARDRGQYQLNPVGYNLIAYKLPVEDSAERKTTKRSPRKVMAKKRPRKKTRKRS
jgi:hypothetical protein